MHKEERISTYLVRPEEALLTAVDVGLSLIEKVHGVFPLPLVPIYYLETARAGGYTPQPRSIEISLLSPRPVLTIVHEVGHLLDDALGDFEVYSSMEQGTPIYSVVQTALQSESMQAMQEYLAVTSGMTLTRLNVMKWMDVPEIWARAYAQYIALRSEDVMLQIHLQEEISLAQEEIERYVQWQYEDFAPIAGAIDEMFEQLGWLQ